MFKTNISTNINEAADFLKSGELVAIPTETVYGLAANACSEKAIKKVFNVKRRPSTNPLIVHVANADKIKPYVKYIPVTAKELLSQFSPGPLTILLPGNGVLPPIINSGRRDIAFRIPGHPLTLDLLQKLDFPLVAPSANIFTTISPTTVEHVLKNFNGSIPYILDGGSCSIGIESTVIGFDQNEDPLIYRQGAITADQIKEVTGSLCQKPQTNEVISPGLFPHHYAPGTPTVLIDDISHLPINEIEISNTGVLCFNKYAEGIPRSQQIILSVKSNLDEAAKNLYRSLHYLDEKKLNLIIVEKVPNIGLGIAINDRLKRATYPVSKHNYQRQTTPLCQVQSFAATEK